MGSREGLLTRFGRAHAAMRFGAGGLVATLVIACSHAQSTRAINTDTLRLVISESPRNLNPIFASTVDEGILASLSFETLVIIKPDATFEPRLAREVPSLSNGGISRDGKRVTFHLRHGIRWQDGAVFSSADVAFTLRTILDPKVPVPERSGYEQIDSIETPSDDTVILRLKKAYSPFIAIVGTWYPIVPKHLLEKSANLAQDPFNASPIGTGPYRFVRQDRGERVVYQANDAYWDGPPKIKRISVAEIPDKTTSGMQLRQGALDYADEEASQFAQLRHDPTLEAVMKPNNSFVAYGFNVERPIGGNRDVRRAISMAIDREGLVRKATFGTGTPAYADLPPFMWIHTLPKNPYGYNLAGARALLDRAGWLRGSDGIRVKDGKRLRLSLIGISGSVTRRNVDTQVQSMLAGVGIEVELKYFSPSLYYAPPADGGPVAKGDFDLAASDESAGGDPNNENIYTCSHREPNGFNAARYCNSAMEALQRASLIELDPKKRLAIVAKIEALAVSDAPYVFLYYTPFCTIHSKRLRNSASALNPEYYRVDTWFFAR